jgi:hypothetical protein
MAQAETSGKLSSAATLGGKGYFGHWQTQARSRPVVYFVR